MSFIRIFALAFPAVFLILPSPAVHAETKHTVYFRGTESELEVYRIEGREKGPTMLIVGGIQGDEAGGYLAADLYADLALRRGTLIVVPRANFLSIVKNRRGVWGDMNRKFSRTSATDAKKRDDKDVQVVEILKSLMSKSDCFLNLHDGSGFFASTWESPMRNPRRYGQSIITDADEYETDDGKVVNPGDIARRVIERVNAQISDPAHVFRFNNHRTSAQNSLHKEQRRSATYYALTKVGIPAFGIETSKSIPDYRLRVRYQTMVINAFLEEFGIIPEQPKIYLENPQLKYLIVSINGRTPIVVGPHDVVTVQKGDRVRVVHIESNYSRGLTARFTCSGRRLNDLNHEIRVTEDTTIEVRKDRFRIAEVPVKIGLGHVASTGTPVHFEPRVVYFSIQINEVTYLIRPEEEVTAMRGDRIVLHDPKTNLAPDAEKAMRIDFRGFQAASSPYPLEDRGHRIDTDADLQEKYGIRRDSGIVYTVQAKLDKKVFGQCYVRVDEPKLDYVILRTSGGGSLVAYPEDRLEVPAHQVLRITDIRTNAAQSLPLSLTMSGRTVRWTRNGSAGIDASKLPSKAIPLHVTRGDRSLGRIWVKQGDALRLSSSGGSPHSSPVPVRY